MNDDIPELKATIRHSRNLCRDPTRLSLEEPVNITYDTIDVAEHLGCRLTPTALDQTYGHRNWSSQKIVLAKALLVFGSVLMLCTLAYYWLSAPWHNEESIGFRINWGIHSLIVLGLMSLPIICGIVLLRTEKSRLLRRLEDLKHSGFETKEMNTEFDVFKSMGLACKPKIGFALTENRLLTVPEEVWQSPDLAVIIFGTEKQCRSVLNVGPFALSSLVMRRSDWEEFATVWEEKKNATTSPKRPLSLGAKSLKTQPDKNDTKKKQTSDKEPSTTPTKPLSLRQKARKENTNWCPCFEMISLNKRYLEKYKNKKLDLNDFPPDRQPCHRLLVLMHANFEDLKLFFEKGELTENQEERLSRLDNKVKRALSVVRQDKISRYNQLKIKKWIVLEKHIEDAGVISDEELVRENPHLKRFQDSQRAG